MDQVPFAQTDLSKNECLQQHAYSLHRNQTHEHETAFICSTRSNNGTKVTIQTSKQKGQDCDFKPFADENQAVASGITTADGLKSKTMLS